ncbi:MAG: hypothetical protein H6613_09540 [Ignavibacteriales bacterium]|nr:hypothetical protein [Ignavibacteriales bacterium]
MGERFASCYPYLEERDDSSSYPVSHFSHIGIHAHEFCHLLGFKDLLHGCDNEYFCLMSKGCFNGPRLEGSCPAPINPYFRWVLGWNSMKIINESIKKEIKYNLTDSDIYKLQDNCSFDFFLVEYRNFNSKMKLGDHLIPDYNSHIKNVSLNNGILIWRKLTGNYVMLMHSCGNLCSNCNHFMFPGENNIRVINPWSDCRQSRCGYYWVPNTKPTSNCGLEIVECNDDHYVVDFYQKYPENASPSTPRNIELIKGSQVKFSWSQNLEPDFEYYKVYKKFDHQDYKLYDTVSISSYTDSIECMATNANTYGYAYYKITSYDLENKESTFSKEIKVPITFNLTTNINNEETLADDFILHQNYPNPFNPSTTIKYSIPSPSVMLNSFQHLNNEIPKQAMPAGRQVRDDNVNVTLKSTILLAAKLKH